MLAYVAADHDCPAGMRLAEVGEPAQASPDQAVIAVAWTAINRGSARVCPPGRRATCWGGACPAMWSRRPRTAQARPKT
jgi:hypothetical protein